MNTDIIALLDKHFDLAVNAPDGIKRLREMILTLAMQGKLVPQDPKDQPASKLLKEIEAEKKRLVKEGKIKEPKPLPPIKPEEVPYEVPETWEWVNFGDIAQHNSGKTLDSGRNTGELRDYITTSNLYWGRFELENKRQMPIQSDELENCTAKKNDLLICEGGEAGRAAVWMFDYEVCFQNHIHRARFYSGIEPFYAYQLFVMMNYSGEIERFRKGVGISNMSSKSLASIPFPLPPFAEQRCIVAKIDELMARVDELERKRDARNEKRLAMHQAAIARLLDAGDANASSSGRDFIFAHFGELYGTKENVAELRKAILQLAVMGRLVPQDPQDQPASELLKEIEAEKKRLVQEGKIKEPKPLPQIKPEEVPYQVPKGWEWVRFGSCALIERGGSPRPIEAYITTDNDGLNWIKIGDTEKNGKYITSTREKIRKEGLVKTRMVYPGDFLLTNSMSFGRPYICQIQGCIHDGWLRISPSVCIDKEYLYHLLSGPYVYKMFSIAAAGAVVQNLNADKVRELLIPLPPLAEQRRIVAKVDELMALCDKFDKQIDQRTVKESALLEAVAARV